jgi:hypothetical protein
MRWICLCRKIRQRAPLKAYQLDEAGSVQPDVIRHRVVLLDGQWPGKTSFNQTVFISIWVVPIMRAD